MSKSVIELNEGETIIIKKFDTKSEAVDFLKGMDYKFALEDIWTRLFRPRHKHGYNDNELNNLIGYGCGNENNMKNKTFTYDELIEKVNVVMDKLEDIYREVLRDNIGEE